MESSPSGVQLNWKVSPADKAEGCPVVKRNRRLMTAGTERERERERERQEREKHRWRGTEGQGEREKQEYAGKEGQCVCVCVLSLSILTCDPPSPLWRP